VWTWSKPPFVLRKTHGVPYYQKSQYRPLLQWRIICWCYDWFPRHRTSTQRKCTVEDTEVITDISGGILGPYHWSNHWETLPKGASQLQYDSTLNLHMTETVAIPQSPKKVKTSHLPCITPTFKANSYKKMSTSNQTQLPHPPHWPCPINS